MSQSKDLVCQERAPIHIYVLRAIPVPNPVKAFSINETAELNPERNS